MTDKQLYLDVQTANDSLVAALAILQSKVNLTPDGTEISTQLSQIETASNQVQAWAQENYDEIAGQEVMNAFLAELKLLFTEYSVILEALVGEEGYGENYGGAGPGIKFTVTQNGLTNTKILADTTLTSEDL